MLLNLRKLMDINVISHTKAALLNLGSTDRIDCWGSVELDKEKITVLFSLTSNLNLAFHAIMNVGNKNVCLSTSVSLAISTLCIQTHFSENKSVGFARLTKDSMAQERLRNPSVREEHRLGCLRRGC
jgi:hypothetical protein